jgi:hypothetical protein
MDIHGNTVIEGYARVTHVAGFAIGPYIFAVDRFRQDTGTGGFAYAPRTTEQEGMRQLLVLDSILQGGSDMSLTYNSIESLWPVFSG